MRPLEGLRPADGEEICDRCGTRYRRVDGARIRIQPPGKPAETRSAGEWLDMLSKAGVDSIDSVPPEPVVLRIAETWRKHWISGVYLGRIEQFGPEMPGTLRLEPDRLTFDGGETRLEWRLFDLTAVQPSSRTLQLKLRTGPLLSFKFPEGSALLWEMRVQRALQELYSGLGRGRILEFQPRIVTR